MVKPGMTLLEILVSISILALIAALTLTSISALGLRGKRARTDVILATALSAIELNAAESGGHPEPAEHPVAGSLAPRNPFVRRSGGNVATTGFALVGVTLAQVPTGDQSRVLLPDDRCADTTVPGFFGWPRNRCTILGVPQANVTAIRRLPPNQVASSNPDRSGTVESVSATSDAHQRLLERVLSRGGLDGELRSLGGLSEAPASYGNAVRGGQLLSDVAPGAAGQTHWEPGRFADGSHPTEIGKLNWKLYRLPGLNLVDAWGHEVLYWIGDAGQVTLASAGQDGAFAIDPGKNQLLDSTDANGSAMGDDRDGQRDNRYAGTPP